LREEIFEASLSPEIQQKMAQLAAVVKGEGTAAISFYDPLDESFEGKKARLTTKVFSNDRMWDLLKGTYDVHLHTGPSVHTERLFDELEFAKQYCYQGLAGFVAKDMHTASVRSLKLVQQVVDKWAEENHRKKVELFGGVCLNYPVGGLNPDAVIAAYRIGGKYVWLPSMDANHHRKLVGHGEGQGISLIDENDNVVPQMKEILALMAETDMVLGIGHQSTRERLMVVREAVKMGVQRIEINHINYSLTWLTPEQCKIFADLGAYLGIYSLDIGRMYIMEDIMAIYKAVGPERIVFGSDTGHIANPHPIDSLRMLILGCLQSGIPDEHVRMMCQTNAYNLLH
jgi:hypothetical protein